ncbi:MAG: cysteine desulfurase family protein [Parcubacteria group bacterium]
MIYLDHAAATPIDPRVIAAMEHSLKTDYGNPSGAHALGRVARQSLSDARTRVARVLGCSPDELIFVGSGTESDNTAILGVARAAQRAGRGKHVIVSDIEHKAVLKAAEVLEREGFDVTRLPVDQHGIVVLGSLKKALRPDTVLVSVMYANNEIGTIQPLRELARLAHAHKVPLHTDACQAAGALPLKVTDLGADLMTLNGSKIYGPKGVGLLYCRKGVELDPLIVGGSQEDGKRAGTENLAAIVGFAIALEIAEVEREQTSARLVSLRDWAIKKILTEIPSAELTGHATLRLPNNIHVSFEGIQGDALVSLLDDAGLAASAGSSCDSKSFAPSHVMLALGLPYTRVDGSLRLTLGRSTTKDQLQKAIDILRSSVAQLHKRAAPKR